MGLKSPSVHEAVNRKMRLNAAKSNSTPQPPWYFLHMESAIGAGTFVRSTVYEKSQIKEMGKTLLILY